MKRTGKVLSLVLIVAALLGMVGGGSSLRDVNNVKIFWEDKGEKATESINMLEDGLNQLGENEEAYLEGREALEKGKEDFAEGQEEFTAGKELRTMLCSMSSWALTLVVTMSIAMAISRTSHSARKLTN